MASWTARDLAVVLLLAAAVSGAPAAASGGGENEGASPGPTLVTIFLDTPIHFLPDSAAVADSSGAALIERAGSWSEDQGRIARTTMQLPEIEGPHRITALVTIHPVPKSDREVFDRWDRAGNVRLIVGAGPEIEVVRFMTAYGGRTEHEVDVTHLAPLLRGERTFGGFIDTWVHPAWTIDLSLRYTPVTDLDNAAWAAPVYYSDSFNRQEMPAGVTARIEVPQGMARVVMKVFATGHCTDGRDEDEFVSKANVITIDGVVVARFHPWRDDCRRFRERNPYTARWTDGSWSSDYSRCGWCPGVEVLPLEFDLTDHLTPGEHTVGYRIEEIRPRGDDGHFGYWRISAHLVGWDHPPRLWRNE